MKVVCINDKNLPEGAEVKQDQEYNVIQDFINNWGQRVYIIEGISNQGITSKGLSWHGYDSNRFRVVDSEEVKEVSYNYTLN